MWLFRHKYLADGTLSSYKACLIANGSTQLEGVDVDETFSLVVKTGTIQNVLSLAASRRWPIHQLDVKNAFLHASSESLLHQIIRSLHQEFAMTDLGLLNYFLVVSVTRDSSRLFLSQKKYAPEILDRVHMANCNPSRTPIDTDSKLGSDGDPVFDQTLYRSLADYGLQLFSSSTTKLVAYSDADWVGCPTTRRLTFGYYVFLGNNLLSWSSKRQPTISRSSVGAEYRGVANAVAETCWLRKLLRDLHTPLSFATLVYFENVSAVYLSCNLVQHQRTKHIEIDIHFVRDLVATSQVRCDNRGLSRLYKFSFYFWCMGTRSSARNLFPPFDNPELTIRRRSRADPTLLNDFKMVAEGNGDLPVLDLRTMEELCHSSLNGRGGPIALIAIQETNFGLKNDMIQQSIKVNGVTDDALSLYLFPHSLTHHATAWFDRLRRNSINTFDQMAKMFLGKYFPPSMVTKLRNEITNFHQRPNELLFKAWERYKLSIDRCPNHNMLPVTQIDTFYNGLTLRHRDTINAVAGGTFMKRRPEECYDLIKNMIAHHNDWDTSSQRSESSSSITSSFDLEIVALKAEMAEINKNLMRVLQPPLAKPRTYMLWEPIKENDAILKNMQTNMTSLTNSNLELKNMFGQFMKMNTASSSGLGTLPGNTITNSKEDLKGITTRRGTVYQRPTIPTTFSSLLKVVERETEMTKDTMPPTNNGSTKEVQPLVVQTKNLTLNSEPIIAPIIEPVAAPVSASKPNQKPLIPYPSRLHDQKAIAFNLDQTSRYSSNYNDITTNQIDVIDMACEEYLQEVLGFSDVIASGNPTTYYDPIVSTSSPTLTPFGDSDFLLEEGDAFLALEDDPTLPKVDQSYADTEGDILLLEAFLNDDPSLPPPNQGNYLPQVRKELKFCEAKTDKSSINKPSEVELKDLPPHLEYAFLEGDDKLPVIIAKDLSDDEKTTLIMSLGKPRTLCTKKGGLTVVKNEENELIPTRLVTGWRVCIDYHKLNEATRKDHFPLPFMDQMLKRLARNEYYCFLDGFSGYFQIPIDPKDQEKTTFTCPYGTFAYHRMPFRLCNAPGTFQRCMMAIFHDMIEKTIEVFMDDFLVIGNSFQTCLSHLEKMLKRCEDINLCLNWEKSHFMVKEGIVLDQKISKNRIKVDKAKVDVIAKLPLPTTFKGIRNFLGHAGFYRRFIKDFSKIAWPMTRLLEKDTPFFFSKVCVEAFQTLKRKLTEAPILIAPDWVCPLSLCAMQATLP
nr:reverse transcriptase domain-containing protein [Tanacetum cinerariifolium]